MAHFAKLDENNIVLEVVVVDNENLLDDNGQESEFVGIAFCKSVFGQNTRWVQTSYNSSFRGRFAGVGYVFDEALNVFIEPQPFPSWTLDSSGNWNAPIPTPAVPENYGYLWDEANLNWNVFLRGATK